MTSFFPGWAQQAQEHASQALEVLRSSQQEERVSCLNCFLTIHQTLGSAALLLGKYPCLQKSNVIVFIVILSVQILFRDTIYICVCDII